jgi:hypothetical protein
VPFDPTHPDPEQLAALQAGELAGADGARVAAHVAGCAECARVLAMAERGRSALTGLPEAEPPAGLHQRLAAALERELEVGDGIHQGLADGNGLQERRLAAAAADAESLGEAAPVAGPDVVVESAPAGGQDGHGKVAEPVPLAGRRRRLRPRDRRMAALLSAAAAVILLVAGLVPLLRHTGGQATTSAEGGAGAAPNAAASGAPGTLRVFSAPDGYSGSALESTLASDPQARAAYQRAAGVHAESGGPQAVGPQFQRGGGEAKSTTSAGSAADNAGRGASSQAAPSPAGLQQGACVANARKRAGNQGLRPAFFVDTVYQGRPATVLVTVRPGAGSQADLWAFPRGNCSSPPFAHELVKVTPP